MESASLTEAAFHPHAAAMTSNESVRDHEPEPGATGSTRCARIDLRELAKELRQVIRRDAASTIPDRHLNTIIDRNRRDSHLLAHR